MFLLIIKFIILSMKDRVVNYFFEKIKIRNPNLDTIKLEELKYGLYAIYTFVTKGVLITLISLILGIFKEYILFLIFYGLLRSVGYGTHAKSNLMCWLFSTLLMLGIPYIFSIISISCKLKLIIWFTCFVNYLIFCPADTEKKPMISKVRKLKFKVSILIVSIIYLMLIFKISSLSNLILGAMILEGLLTNPLGYILMGQKIRFRLNDLNIFKLN